MTAARWLAFAFAFASACCVFAAGGVHAAARAGVYASAGSADVALNPDALAAIGVRIEAVERASRHADGKAGVAQETATFEAGGEDRLELRVRDSGLAGFGPGALRFAGGFVFASGEARIDLRGFTVRARSPGEGTDVALADAGGTAWLVADHVHYDVTTHVPAELSVRQMDLRLAPAFAAALGRRDLAGRVIGTLAFRAVLDARDAKALAGGRCEAPWPAPGRRTNIQLSYSNLSGFWDSIYVPRCGLPPLPGAGACTAESTNGKVVMSADASLRNVGETAVAWYAHFSGEHPPYGNDQHPFLVWNLYRVDRDGRIRQIGVSAAKHAFFSINERCRCAGGNVFWPGCEDIYSASSNDNGSGNGEQNLAPRAEIVPFTGQWARCGSAWDRDCDGRMDPGSGAQDLYRYRMLVDESDLLPPLATGARYFFEYWYVVRDDADVYDTMGHREIRPRKTGAAWQVDLVDAGADDHDFFLGPVVNRWVDPAHEDATRTNRELQTPLGRARVAAKATDLGGGRWRYEYAVMNVDYALVRFDPAHAREPDLKLLESRGFTTFSVPVPDGVAVESARSADADGDGDDDWRMRVAGGAVTWNAPASRNSLAWGTLHHFEFVARRAPAIAPVVVATSGDPVRHAVDAVVPGR
ncbi:hypothetical protein [Dokdonella fugitiva]|uniref:hypothetical protein n=1 Tax=Dokdonella fugitiva TaxID=328517 RepID=UPI0015FBE62F|nr:hypothetical protein [Dokdonella fugitiva]MBA8884029.1 hypothetical protein [Dokdonella fugitiva]